MRKNSFSIILIIIGLLACYPIFRYVYYFELHSDYSVVDKFVRERIFVSSPVLIILGVVMLLMGTKFQKIAGILFLIIGIVWAFFVLKEAFNEAG